MKANFKVVIDTNVLISATLSPKGTPAQLLRLVIEKGRLVFSDATFEEFHSRLWKPKFDPYITRELRQAVLQDFSNIADWLEPQQIVEICRDADDNKFLSLALSADVDYLISGDRDLTVLKQIESIPILTPAQALKRLTTN